MNSNKLKRKLLLRRVSSATPLNISYKSPVWLRLLLMFIGLAFAVAAGVWLYEQGASFAGFNKQSVYQELEQLRIDNKKISEDHDRLVRLNISAESALMIEKATAKQILANNQHLEAENNKLKEDLRFFEALLPASGSDSAINIRNLQGRLDEENKQLSVRLLVMQNGKQVNSFTGQLQFIVTGNHAGQAFTINYPIENRTNNPETQLNFTRYQRVELNIPINLSNLPLKNIHIDSLQVRVKGIEGTIKAQASGTLIQGIL